LSNLPIHLTFILQYSETKFLFWQLLLVCVDCGGIICLIASHNCLWHKQLFVDLVPLIQVFIGQGGMSMVSSKAPSWVAYCSHYLKLGCLCLLLWKEILLQWAFMLALCSFMNYQWCIFLARCLKTLDLVRTEFYDLRGKFQTMLQVLQFIWLIHFHIWILSMI
jgi:hypothetical protein